MKKKCILALVLGAAFMAQGCGYTEGTDAVVTVVDATPTPEPTEAPEPTATPEPQADAAADTADSTATTEQTPSGITVEVKEETYYAVEGVNLRSDASADAEFIAGVLSGEALKSTGVCANGWIRVDYNGQACYASGDYVSTTPPVGAAAVDTTAADTVATDTGAADAAQAQQKLNKNNKEPCYPQLKLKILRDAGVFYVLCATLEEIRFIPDIQGGLA